MDFSRKQTAIDFLPRPTATSMLRRHFAIPDMKGKVKTSNNHVRIHVGKSIMPARKSTIQKSSGNATIHINRNVESIPQWDKQAQTRQRLEKMKREAGLINAAGNGKNIRGYNPGRLQGIMSTSASADQIKRMAKANAGK